MGKRGAPKSAAKPKPAQSGTPKARAKARQPVCKLLLAKSAPATAAPATAEELGLAVVAVSSAAESAACIAGSCSAAEALSSSTAAASPAANSQSAGPGARSDATACASDSLAAVAPPAAPCGTAQGRELQPAADKQDDELYDSYSSSYDHEAIAELAKALFPEHVRGNRREVHCLQDANCWAEDFRA